MLRKRRQGILRRSRNDPLRFIVGAVRLVLPYDEKSIYQPEEEFPC